jgi:putative transposase
MKPLNFSSDNIANQFKYLKRNLKDLGIWQDLEYKVKQTVKFTIQNLLFEEFALYMQARRYQRTDLRKDYRSGYYKRSLVTTYGLISDIQVPKARKLRPDFKVFKKYQQRQEKFDYMILLSLILGLSCRKQRQFFKNFFQSCVSHTTASKLLTKLEYELKNYRTQPVRDDYSYLVLDAIWMHIKELNIKNRPILFAMGIREDESKQILGFKLAKSESEQEWLSFLNDLYRRGLEGKNLKLIISDNCPGLKSALNFVYPYTPVQLCVVHKLRNILNKIKQKKKHRKKLIKQASEIFKAKDREEAIIRINKFVKNWHGKEPQACKCLQRDLADYLRYYEFPANIRDKLKSTNALERLLREIRRIAKRVGYFQNQRSLELFIFGYLKEANLIAWEGENLERKEVSNFAKNY